MAFVGTVYQNFILDTAAPTVLPPTGPSAQFAVNDVNFYTSDSPTTSTATFFKNPVFYNQTGGFDPAGPIASTLTKITGSLYLLKGANTFIVSHDDGVTLDISGIGRIVNAPLPTAMADTPFTVSVATAGYYSFVLWYNENEGGAAGLLWTINSAPPVANLRPIVFVAT